MRWLALGYAIGVLAGIAKPKIEFGEGFGDKSYDYIEVRFPSYGLQLDWWRE